MGDPRRFFPRIEDVVVARTFLAFAWVPVWTHDFWLHWATGRVMRTIGRVPRIHPLSLREGELEGASWGWDPHEWLHQWVSAWAVDGLGLWSILVLRGIVAALVAWCLWKVIRRVGTALVPALVLLVIGLQVASPGLWERPGTWSVLGFAFVLLARNQRAYWLPLVFLAWAQLHGGVVLGLAAVTWFSIGQRREIPRLVAMGSWIAACIQPRGPMGLVSPMLAVSSSDSPSQLISEWSQPAWGTPWGLWLCVLLGLSGWALLRHWGRVGLRDGVVLVVLALMTVVSQRHAPFLALAFGSAASSALAPLDWGRSTQWYVRLESAASAARGFYLTPLVIMVSAVLLHDAPNRLWDAEQADLPFSAVRWCDERAGGVTEVFCEYEWGGYLQARGTPGLRVFVDGSMRQGKDVLALYIAVQRLEADLPPVDAAVVRRGSLLDRSMLAMGWSEAAADAVSRTWIPPAEPTG